MSLEANFNSVISADLKVLSIVDASTEGYDGESIVSRSVEITTAEGDSETFNFPIISGVGDALQYPVEKDMAIMVVFKLVPASAVGESEYSKVKNLLLPNRLLNCIQEKRKDQLHSCSSMCDQRAFDELEVVDSFFQTAKSLVGSDLLGSQEALDKGNRLCNAKSCDSCQR